MNRISSLTSFWQNISETDLRPIRDQAMRGMQISIVASSIADAAALADQLRRDPHRPQLTTDAPIRLLDLEAAKPALSADLIILLITVSQPDFSRYQDLVRAWQELARRVVILIDFPEPPADPQSITPWPNHDRRRVLFGSIGDPNFILEKFAPAVVELLPDHHLALGRNYPLFRIAIAHHLINDTSFSNAAYAMSTGIASIVPVFDIPLTIADTIVLTKAQAFLVYRLGLALGYSTRWQDYIGEFGSVIGGGFVLRQLARSLVGLIPFWGIVPKTAIAYSGTYVVGNAILQWYLTGRHISKNQMRLLYQQATERGKILARSLLSRLPHPHLRLPPLLPSPRKKARQASLESVSSSKPLPPAKKRRGVCPNCARRNAKNAKFCQYCGNSLDPTI